MDQVNLLIQSVTVTTRVRDCFVHTSASSSRSSRRSVELQQLYLDLEVENQPSSGSICSTGSASSSERSGSEEFSGSRTPAFLPTRSFPSQPFLSVRVLPFVEGRASAGRSEAGSMVCSGRFVRSAICMKSYCMH